MTPTPTIDFVSDISCPWCAIGLSALEQALANLQGEVAVDIHVQPFELNPLAADVEKGVVGGHGASRAGCATCAGHSEQ